MVMKCVMMLLALADVKVFPKKEKCMVLSR